MNDQILYEDTRQIIKPRDKHKRKHDWWKNHGVQVVRKTLSFGDYVLDGSNVVVDTKRNIQEVAMDCGRDHERFAREMERAREAGCRLVILIETGGNYKTVDDLERWLNDTCTRCTYKGYECHPPTSRCLRFRSRPMSGVTLSRIMKTMADHHGCRFELCHPLMAAKRVCDLLGVRYVP